MFVAVLAALATPAAEAAAADGFDAPTVHVAWKRDRATLAVVAPPGAKLAADAPAAVTLAWGERSYGASTDGQAVAAGIGVPDLRGATLTGTLEASVCDLAGTTCRMGSWTLSGSVTSASRGDVALSVAAGAKTAAEPRFGPTVTAAPADAAFARAAKSGKPVLLDFSAVWCPPCNLLAAQVLDAEPRPLELDGFEVAVLDVDHPSSFAIKDKYKVGGYPTILVVDPAGNELTRTVGFDTREAFLAWLAGAGSSTDGKDLAGPVDALSPERAAELAWRVVQRGTPDDAAALLARAEGADTVELHLARFAVAPTVPELEWLLAHAPDQAMAYVSTVSEVPDVPPELARRTLDAALRAARGPEAATALEAAMALAPDDATRRTYASAAAGVVRSALTGDPVADKGWITWLAALLVDAGAADEAVRVLRDAERTYPGEPTFHLALAPMLVELGRCDEGLDVANQAMAESWGDNHLRAALAKSRALIDCGRQAEGRALARDTLTAELPPELANIRTHRYRKQLEALATEPATAP